MLEIRHLSQIKNNKKAKKKAQLILSGLFKWVWTLLILKTENQTRKGLGLVDHLPKTQKKIRNWRGEVKGFDGKWR